MRILKKLQRLLWLVFFITLVIFGAGFMLPTRERYQDKEVRIELVEKKDDESEGESSEARE
jgi:hypothetical protein